ncbi:DNA-directed RNA polymerase III subunit RPC5 [Teleopsis dalmanni]|uniref:DNA-directed RNA polymerase III subunit RPC5 n=1 Tax=Teleopsis dalmanni TaxID=139649 RepID=UPI0018CE63BC|nr:DNA-directed RNA polymerase III subunit RPC5 [Teleopsis dalmanni]
MDVDDDEIVEEIPVYLSKNLEDSLFVFQYPTKSQIGNFDNAEVINCCVKPVNQEVKVDFALNVESKFYDSFKGEQFAISADGKTQQKNERPTYKRGLMDKQTFLSQRPLDDPSKYTVAIYADNEIHISPLSSILQLRPAFSHFDKEDRRKKAEQKALNEEDDEEELQHVTVKFARTGGKKVKEKPGYDNFVKKSSDEPWCETFWHPRLSSTAELQKQKLFATNQQTNLFFTQEPYKYMKKLISSSGQDQGIDAVLPNRIVSKARLKSMSLVEQLRILLRDGRMLSYPDVVNFMQENIDNTITADKVLRTLPQVGILIHGNWVAQSEILYPPESLSNSNGVTADLMIRARDYILFQFSRTPYIYRRQVISATQLPADEAFEVLKSVARLNSHKKWELLLPPDREFEQRNPELVQRQEMVWRATEQTYNEMDFEKSTQRVRKRSVRDSRAQQV